VRESRRLRFIGWYENFGAHRSRSSPGTGKAAPFLIPRVTIRSMAALAVVLMLAASFWETKAPADWTDDELVRLFTDSPWAVMTLPAAAETNSAAVQVFLATAAPVVEAEKERERRYVIKANGHPVESALDTEYRLWMEDNRATQIVVAVRIARAKDFDDAALTKRMEEESVMDIGRKKFKMTGNFPPTERDPFLRIAFPREVKESDKKVTFELYVPGVTPPYRSAEFRVKDMIYKGKLAM